MWTFIIVYMNFQLIGVYQNLKVYVVFQIDSSSIGFVVVWKIKKKEDSHSFTLLYIFYIMTLMS